MALFSVGGDIPKVVIEAYEMADFTKLVKVDGKDGKIMLPLVSLDSLKQSFKIKWGGDESGTAAGASAPVVNFIGYDFETADLELDVIVDATGIFRPEQKDDHLDLINYDKPNVGPYVTMLKKIVYGFGTEAHQPPYLKLVWGTIFGPAETGVENGGTPGCYKGVLKSMEVDYKLFSVSGNPVRADIKLTIKPFMNAVTAPGVASPDLTHIIEIKHGDNLTKLSKQVYESPEYAHQIARINGLASVYALRPGMKLVFPPLDKMDRVS